MKHLLSVILFACAVVGSMFGQSIDSPFGNPRLVIQLFSADPATCTTSGGVGESKIYYNTTSSQFKYCSAPNTWTAISAGLTIGGSNTQVQFNSTGTLGGSVNLTWVSPILTIGVNGTTSGGLALANGAGGGNTATFASGATSAYTLTTPASVFAQGDLQTYSNATGQMASVVDVATGSVLTSGGVGIAPTYSASPTITTSVSTAAFISTTASVASAGQIRLANADTIKWRNNANGADVQLAKTGALANGIPADSLDVTAFGAIKGPQYILPNNVFLAWVNSGGNGIDNGIRVNAADVLGTNGNLIIGGNLLETVKTTQYNNINTAGIGVVAVFGATLQKSETQAADANVLTYTPPASAGSYKVHVNISVSSATAGVISYTVSWTDSNGNAQSNIAGPLFQYGTAAPNTTFTTSAAGNYGGIMPIDINNAAANIIVKWVGGGTSAAKMSAWIEQAQ